MKNFNEMKQSLEDRMQRMKQEIGALYYACKHPATPMIAKITALIVVGYALSPIDLIPDFIPVLGYLDDVILLPLGIALVIKLVPEEIMAECRQTATARFGTDRRKNWMAGAVVVGLWVGLVWLIITKIVG